MTTALWLAGAGLLLYALHRGALWMEARGWVYYRKKRGASGALGSAFLEVQSMFDPSKRHVLEVKRNTDPTNDDAGDPPTDGGVPR